jgi:CBS domain-containing protein
MDRVYRMLTLSPQVTRGEAMTIPETPLARVHVQDVMHTGMLTTDPTTPLRVAARLMVEQRVHAVAVADPDHSRRPWGFITDLDVAAASAEGLDETAGEAAKHDVVTISATDSLNWAAHQMMEHGVSHLVVVDPNTGHPIGILSTLDVASAYAG